jgi:hypothetical protein
MNSFWANHPAGGSAGAALQFGIGYHWPGVPQPGYCHRAPSRLPKS